MYLAKTSFSGKLSSKCNTSFSIDIRIGIIQQEDVMGTLHEIISEVVPGGGPKYLLIEGRGEVRKL